MDIRKTIEILEALVSGCSPSTGEVIGEESILNERDVIRALQIAIDRLSNEIPPEEGTIHIPDEEIKNAIVLFKQLELAPTYSRLAGFFLATRRFENELIHSNRLYGKYHGRYQKGQVLDFFMAYLADNGYSKHGKKVSSENEPWKTIDFFRRDRFNNLSEHAIIELKEAIKKLGVLKTDNLATYIQIARTNYPRAYEAWTDVEKTLLRDAMQYTNDLSVLSDCFQRGEGSIASFGQKLIYENQILTNG
ncbi:hypothetical protein [Niabella sp.]|uniref:hypothetical protein n=1 Tax=Niabella sp. TaxID=1962976 RepID=UPI0026044D6F|nr:hypothetical protein [Niabella sp.]